MPRNQALRYATVDEMPEALRQQGRAREAGLRKIADADVSKVLRLKKPTARRDDEHTAQVVFFNRIRTLALNDPRYALAARRTFAIPNGGGRSKREAGRLKAEGVLPGVSDIFCALAAQQWHGLWLEMKSETGDASQEQRAWCDESFGCGYLAVVCRGADRACTVWKAYVEGTLE